MNKKIPAQYIIFEIWAGWKQQSWYDPWQWASDNYVFLFSRDIQHSSAHSNA